MQATTIGSNLTIVTVNGGGSGTRTPVENWELDCEICHRKGLNQVSNSLHAHLNHKRIFKGRWYAYHVLWSMFQMATYSVP